MAVGAWPDEPKLTHEIACLEAADAILAMAEDNRRLSTLARANNDLARHEANGRRELQAENARLREALGDIANESSDSWARDLARQALAATGDGG